MEEQEESGFFDVTPKSNIKENAIDLTKAGPATFRAIREANNSKFQNTGAEDWSKAFNTAMNASSTSSMYDIEDHADKVVQSELYNTNTRWGESMWDDEGSLRHGEFSQLQDRRANNQWGIAQIGAGIVKGVGLAGTTFLEGTLGLLTAPAAMAYRMGAKKEDGSDYSASEVMEYAWNDPFKQGLSEWNKKLEEWFPNYKTKKQENDIWSAANILSANFAGDTLLKNAGFLAGAAAAGYVTGGVGIAALAGVTKAAQLIPAAAKVIAKISKGVGTVVGAFTAGSAEAGSQTRDDISQYLNTELTGLNERIAAQSAPIINKYNALTAQAIAKLKDVYQEGSPAYEEAVKRIEDEYGALLEEELKPLQAQKEQAEARIKDEARKSGNMGYCAQTALLALTDANMFGGLFSRGFNTSRRMQSRLARGANPQTTQTLVNAAKSASPAMPQATVTEAGKGAFDSWRLRHPGLATFWSGAKNPLEEGSQEVLQSAVSNSVTNRAAAAVSKYYESGQDADNQLTVAESLNASAKGFYDTFKSPDAWMEGFVGAILGGVGIPMKGKYKTAAGIQDGWHLEGGIAGGIRENNIAMATDEKLASHLNNWAHKPETVRHIQGLTRLNTWQQEKDKALLEDDQFTYDNADHKQLVEMVSMYSDAGRLDDLKEMVKNSLDTSDESLAQIQRDTTTTINGKPDGVYAQYDLNDEKSKEEFRSKIEEKKNAFLNTIEAYNDTRNNIDAISKGVFSDEQLNELTWYNLNAKNALNRGTGLLEESATLLENTIPSLEQKIRDLQSQVDTTSTASGQSEEAKEAAEKLEYYKNLLKNIQELKSNPNKLAVLKAVGKDKEAFRDWIDEIDESILSSEDKDSLFTKITDAGRLGDMYGTYMKKYNEYLNNPGSLAKAHEEADKKRDEKIKEEATAETTNKIDSAESIQQVQQVMDDPTIDQEEKDDALQRAIDNGNEEAKGFKIKNDYLRNVNKTIDEMPISDQEKEDAKELLKKQFDNTNNLDEFKDLETAIMTDDSAFNENGEDPNGERFIKAVTAIEKAFGNADTDSSLGESTADPVVAPVNPPVPPTIPPSSDAVMDPSDDGAGGNGNNNNNNNNTNKGNGNNIVEETDNGFGITGQSETPMLPTVVPETKDNFKQEDGTKHDNHSDVAPETVAQENLKLVNKQADILALPAPKINPGDTADWINNLSEIHIDGLRVPDPEITPFYSKRDDKGRGGDVFRESWMYLSGHYSDGTAVPGQANGFEYVNKGNVVAGDEIQFMIDPRFEYSIANRPWRKFVNGPMVWMVQKKTGQVIGQLKRSKDPVQNGLLNAIFSDYTHSDSIKTGEKFFASQETKVTNVKGGIFAVSETLRDLNKIPNIATDSNGNPQEVHLGVVTGKYGTYQMAHNITDAPVIPIEINEITTGRTYVLVKQGNNQYLPMLCTVDHFNKNEFNPVDNPVCAATKLGKAIKEVALNFARATSNPMIELNECFNEFHNFWQYVHLGGGGEIETQSVQAYPISNHTGLGVHLVYTPRDRNGHPLMNPDGSQVSKDLYVYYAKLPEFTDQQGNKITGSLAEMRKKYGDSFVDLTVIPTMMNNLVSEEQRAKSIMNALMEINYPIQVRAGIEKEGVDTLLEANVLHTTLLNGNNYNSYVSIAPVAYDGQMVNTTSDASKATDAQTNNPTPTPASNQPQEKSALYAFTDYTNPYYNGDPNVIKMRLSFFEEGSLEDNVDSVYFDLSTCNFYTDPDCTQVLKFKNSNAGIYTETMVKMAALYKGQHGISNVGNFIKVPLGEGRLGKGHEYAYYNALTGRVVPFDNKPLNHYIDKLNELAESREPVRTSDLAVQAVNEASEPIIVNGFAYTVVPIGNTSVAFRIPTEWAFKQEELENDDNYTDDYVDDYYELNKANAVFDSEDLARYGIDLDLPSDFSWVPVSAQSLGSKLNMLTMQSEGKYGNMLIAEIANELASRFEPIKMHTNDYKKVAKRQGKVEDIENLLKANNGFDSYPSIVSKVEEVEKSKKALPDIQLGNNQALHVYYDANGRNVNIINYSPTNMSVTDEKGNPSTLPQYKQDLLIAKNIKRYYPLDYNGSMNVTIIPWRNGTFMAIEGEKKLMRFDLDFWNERYKRQYEVNKNSNKWNREHLKQDKTEVNSDIYNLIHGLPTSDKTKDNYERWLSSGSKPAQQTTPVSQPTTQEQQKPEQPTPSTGSNSSELKTNNEDDFFNDIFNNTKNSIVNEVRETWNKKKETEWLERVLPQLSSKDRLKFTEGLINIAGRDAKAWGQYSNGIITLSDVAAEGTLYHEAFHAVMDMMLNTEQKDAIFKEAQEKYGISDRNQLEENLAEDFRRYVLNAESENSKERIANETWLSKLGKAIRNFFKSLYIKVKNWNKVQYSIGSLYKAINSGELASVRLNKSENTETANREEESKEMEEILANAPRDSEGRLLAPNGQPSNLNERQYAQVRTKAFKNWFGDWESLASYDGVSIYSPALEETGLTGEEGPEYYITSDYPIYVEGKVIGYIHYNNGRITGNGDIQIFPEYRGKGYGTKAHIALAKYAKSKGETLKSDFYNSKDEIRVWESLVRKGLAIKTKEQTGVEHGYSDVNYEFINDALNNDRNVSKVVDENGEPLVVHHGTTADFNIFDKSYFGKTDAGWEGKGFYFAPDRSVDISSSYTGGNGTIKEVFLNIKNPFYSMDNSDIFLDVNAIGVDTLEEFNALIDAQIAEQQEYVNQGNESAINTVNSLVKYKNSMTQQRIDDLNKMYDGKTITASDAIYNMSEIVAIRPNQIKSATDNIGTFSTENNDIRFREVDTNLKPAPVRNSRGETFTEEKARILKEAPRNQVGRLLAPNGKPSALSDKEYVLVRTEAFQKWSGIPWDGERFNLDPLKLDLNGEPQKYCIKKELIDDPFYEYFEIYHYGRFISEYNYYPFSLNTAFEEAENDISKMALLNLQDLKAKKNAELQIKKEGFTTVFQSNKYMNDITIDEMSSFNKPLVVTDNPNKFRSVEDFEAIAMDYESPVLTENEISVLKLNKKGEDFKEMLESLPKDFRDSFLECISF